MTDNIQNVIVRLRAEGADQTGAQVERMAQKTATALQKNSSEARKAAYEMSQVNMQLTDIVVSLASGQQPLTVFLQQGGQLKDMFGGVGGAASAVGRTLLGLVTPFTLVTGGVVALVASYVAGQAQSAAFRDAVLASGNAAGVTEGRFNALAQSVAAATSTTVGNSREIALALVSTGTVGAKALESTAEAVANVARVTGKTGTDVAADFARMSGGVVQWAAEHNKAWNFIDSAQLKYIAQLEKQGKTEEAMIEVNKALNKQFSATQQNLGYLEKAWAGVGKAASSAWNWMLGAGRNDTLQDQIGEIEAKLRERMARGPLAGGTNEKVNESWKKGNDLLKQQLEQLRARASLEQAGANARAEIARREGEQVKKIAEAAKEKDKKPGATKDPEAEYQRMVRETLANRAPRLAEIEAKGYEAANRAAADNMAKTAEQLQRRNDQAADYALQLADQTASLNIGLIADDRQRGEAQIELDRQIMQARIDVWAAGGADVTAAQEALNANIVARQRSLSEQLKPEWQRMLEDWADTTRLMQRTYDDMVGNLVKSSEDAFVKLMTGQKVNWSDYGKQIIADIARGQFRQMAGQNGGGALNSLAALFGQPTTKGYSGNEAAANFMGPLVEGAEEVRMANAKSANATDDLTRVVGELSGQLGGLGSVVLQVARALMNMGSSAGGGAGGMGGIFDIFKGLFGGGGSSAPGSALTVPTDVPGMTMAVGTNRLPSDGWRYLHEGEAVIPKAFNPWAGGAAAGAMGGGGVTLNSTVVVQPGAQADAAALQMALDRRDASLMAAFADQLRRPGSGIYRAART